MNQDKTLKVVLLGGGTVGHSAPLAAVAHELVKQANVELLYIDQRGKSDAKLIKEMFGDIRVAQISAEKFYRYWDPRLLLLPFKFILGIWQSLKILNDFQPGVVFARGGYASVAVVWAAAIRGTPVVIHETDSILSLANRLMAPFARKILTSFDPALMNLRGSKFVCTGQPVREEFFRTKEQKTKEQKTILILGSSQGSKTLNQLISKIKNDLTNKYHLIHIVGKADYPKYRGEKDANYEVIDFASRLAELIARADLVISRSGGTIFDLAAIGKPAILIPLPWAASNHQRENAKILEKAGAVVVLEQIGLDPHDLLNTIENLMGDSAKRHQLAQNIQKFSNPDAVEKIAKTIIENAK